MSDGWDTWNFEENEANQSSSLPKGVMLSHSNIVSNLMMLNWSEGSFLKWDEDKILSVLPYYHIYGTVSATYFTSNECRLTL